MPVPQGLRDYIQLLCHWQHGSDTWPAFLRVVVAAVDAVAEEPAERFNS